jgi:peptidoglycan hydrolase-like protein with peptidoglycan-binding domain
MRILFALLLLAAAASARADDATAKVQQALKDQGFYYGPVNGEKTADTSAAIRRYQIRSGLQITGELNDETLQSLRNTPAPTPKPLATPAPLQQQPPQGPVDENEPDDAREEAPYHGGAGNPVPIPPYGDRPEPPNVGRVLPSGGGLFAGTPYEDAPPDVQRRVIADAQKILTRRGLFKNPVDGFFGAELEFSLRAYQARVGLPTTGQLNLETLAALELLPGKRMPVYGPRRSFPPGAEPPVRGEWIRP